MEAKLRVPAGEDPSAAQQPQVTHARIAAFGEEPGAGARNAVAPFLVAPRDREPAPGAAHEGLPIPRDFHDPELPSTLALAMRTRGVFWLMSIARQLLWARVQLRECDSLGRWVRVRGRVRVHNEGSITIGERVRFRSEAARSELVTWGKGRIDIAAGTTVNYGSSISAAGAVKIGRDCLIGTYVNIMDSTFHNVEDRAWNMEADPVVIGDRVWLGNRCMVMKGVTIGENAVVAACSLVTRDVPPNTMVVGVPARVVKNFQ